MTNLEFKVVELEAKVQALEVYVYDNIILSIEKQYKKINSDVADIKMADLASCVKYWGMIPESYKTPELIEKYLVVEEYYNQHK